MVSPGFALEVDPAVPAYKKLVVSVEQFLVLDQTL